MEISNNQRTAIITTSTLAGAGAGVAIANYMPILDGKNQPSDKFVQQVTNEMDNNKIVRLGFTELAKDHLDTLYPEGKGASVKDAQVNKFVNRYGDILEISGEKLKDKDGKKLTGNALKEKLFGAVAQKEEAYSTATTEKEAKALIKNGLDKKGKLVKANENISEEGVNILKRAIKTVKNERMIKGGVAAGTVALVASAIATCQDK